MACRLGSNAQQFYPITKMSGIAAQPTLMPTSAFGRYLKLWMNPSNNN